MIRDCVGYFVFTLVSYRVMNKMLYMYVYVVCTRTSNLHQSRKARSTAEHFTPESEVLSIMAVESTWPSLATG